MVDIFKPNTEYIIKQLQKENVMLHGAIDDLRTHHNNLVKAVVKDFNNLEKVMLSNTNKKRWRMSARRRG